MSYILLRLRALEVQRGAGEDIGGGAPTQGEVVPTKGGSLAGFRGKGIWDALESPSKHPAIIDKISIIYEQNNFKVNLNQMMMYYHTHQ